MNSRYFSGLLVATIATAVLFGGSLKSQQKPSTGKTAPQAVPPNSTIPSDPLVDVQRGTIPVVISAPHGGLEYIPGVPDRANNEAYRFVTGPDMNTRGLALRLSRELEGRLGGKPYFVFARFRRSNIDANRKPNDAYEVPAAKPYYDFYHDTLAEFCREVQNKFGGGLLIDVHGQATYKDDVLVGTSGGETIKLLRQRQGDGVLVGREGIVGLLQTAGFKTMPAIDATDFNVPKYNGGHIVVTYGSSKPGGIDAIQLEFGSNYRDKEKLDDTAHRAADAVEQFFRMYVAKKQKAAAQ